MQAPAGKQLRCGDRSSWFSSGGEAQSDGPRAPAGLRGRLAGAVVGRESRVQALFAGKAPRDDDAVGEGDRGVRGPMGDRCIPEVGLRRAAARRGATRRKGVPPGLNFEMIHCAPRCV